jgi:predicted MFS family arabinose efflux permease
MNKLLASEKKVLLILCLIQFAHIVDFMMIMPLGAQIMRKLFIGPKEFGILVSSYSFAAGLSGLLLAPFLDRWNKKNTLFNTLILFSIATIGCAIVPSFYGLLCFRFLAGICGGILSVLCLAIVGEEIPAERRGLATGILMSAFSYAAVFGVPFSIFLAATYTWHVPFVVVAITGILVGFFARKTMKTRPLNMIKLNRHSWNVYWQHLHHPERTIGLILVFLLVLGQFSIIPYISPYMVANVGLSEKQLTLIYLIGGGVTIFSSPLVGKCTDLFGRKMVMLVMYFFSLIPLYFMTHLNSVSIVYALSISTLFFFFISGRMIPTMTNLSLLAPNQERTSLMALAAATQNFTASLAALIASRIMDKNSEGQLTGFDQVGKMAVILSLVAIILTLLTRTKKIQGTI